MKTTLELNDQILRRARTRAVREGISLARFVEDALRTKLRDDGRKRPAFKLDLKTVTGHVPPNADISDRKALYDVLDGA
ncbi:hypothetical protein [Candidatus Palauibacter polyketidifaciens]|uniref:hypothetical protein n=1 Tax=Candidatus Palauibacter polyketidifaciens TaxID=3056740 RepID=UPI002398A169|nr:hypothetical protein [Candidatus Palauibacter polyketidifaciens]MDE2720407.1 hypothetical protein [Candidatus Palauibacter polyketidifaciens]